MAQTAPYHFHTFALVRVVATIISNIHQGETIVSITYCLKGSAKKAFIIVVYKEPLFKGHCIATCLPSIILLQHSVGNSTVVGIQPQFPSILCLSREVASTPSAKQQR